MPEPQLSLFAPRPPAATADPETSWAAARKLRQSGQLHAGILRALRLLAAADEPPTSHELAGTDLRLRYNLARRLPDALKLGLVDNGNPRPCRVTRHRAVTWWLTERGRDVVGTA